MAEPLSAHIMRLIPQAVHMYHRLVLVGHRCLPWEIPRGLAPLESRCTLFDERSDAFPSIFSFTADILRKRFKF